MNTSGHCERVFTCIYKETLEKLVLEYGFISSDLEKYFSSMQVDEEKISHHGIALNMVKSFSWI